MTRAGKGTAAWKRHRTREEGRRRGNATAQGRRDGGAHRETNININHLKKERKMEEKNEMRTKNESEDLLKGMSKEQRAELFARLQTEVKNDRMAKRESYEALRGEFMHDVLGRVESVESEVSGFKKWLDEETAAFTKIMREYGAVKNESPTITNK